MLMDLVRRSRSDAPVSKNFGEHLGKSLRHHQVVPASKSAFAGHTSNLPIVRRANELLTGTGGLMRDITTSHFANNTRYSVNPVSHAVKRAIQSVKHNHGVIRPSFSTAGK